MAPADVKTITANTRWVVGMMEWEKKKQLSTTTIIFVVDVSEPLLIHFPLRA